MDRAFPRQYVGFCFESKNQFYYCLTPSQTAAGHWKKLVEHGCEVIYTEDLEEHAEIRYFLARAACYADLWPELVRTVAPNRKK